MSKREIRSRPEWNEFFMMHAYLAATRSSCLKLNTGVVIVKDKMIESTGYNGAPAGIKSSIEHGFCRKEKFGVDFDTKGTGTCRGRHAEENAMGQLSRVKMQGSAMYSVYYPCGSCAKSIVGNGISEIYWSKLYKDKDALAEELFHEGEIKVIKLELDIKKIYDFISKLK